MFCYLSVYSKNFTLGLINNFNVGGNLFCACANGNVLALFNDVHQLIVISTFFPVAVGLLDGFRSVDKDAVGLLCSMGANRAQIFRYIKFPSALPQFFSGLKIAAAYSVVGAVISEWLGGFGGLGVYMTRVKKAFAFDKMFAVIFLISAISLVLMALVELAEKKCMPYRHPQKRKKEKKV